MTTTLDRKESRTHNSTYPKGGVSCFADTFVQAERSVLRMKFSGINPALRVAAKRYASCYKDSQYEPKIFVEWTNSLNHF